MVLRLIRAFLGNTPTGVGKTSLKTGSPSFGKKHPHGRGEDAPVASRNQRRLETPPRAWGRLQRKRLTQLANRNTPTGVGKTEAITQLAASMEKHPHGRGEDVAAEILHGKHVETPPRAWGRRDVGDDLHKISGNTPTGVGKTHRRPLPLLFDKKHPHGRGEDQIHAIETFQYFETPPRAWGRRTVGGSLISGVGNTPTGVGKTTIFTSICWAR